MTKVKFVQIAVVPYEGAPILFALDTDGAVRHWYQGKWTTIESPNQD